MLRQVLADTNTENLQLRLDAFINVGGCHIYTNFAANNIRK